LDCVDDVIERCVWSHASRHARLNPGDGFGVRNSNSEKLHVGRVRRRQFHDESRQEWSIEDAKCPRAVGAKLDERLSNRCALADHTYASSGSERCREVFTMHADRRDDDHFRPNETGPGRLVDHRSNLRDRPQFHEKASFVARVQLDHFDCSLVKRQGVFPKATRG
jgi:hypothetical protein